MTALSATGAAATAITGAATVTALELDMPPAAELLRGERLRAVSIEARLLLAAARLALLDAGLYGDELPIDPDELGIVVATRFAGLQDYVELYRAGTEGERPRVNPARGPQTGLTAPAAELSIRLPAGGPNATVSNGAVGGLDALRYAADQLAAGRAGAMLVCEAEPAPAVLGDGAAGTPDLGHAAVVVLEAEHSARARGATPRVLVAAVATAFSPDGDAEPAGDDAVARLVHAAAHPTGPLLIRAGDSHAAGTAWLHRHPDAAR